MMKAVATGLMDLPQGFWNTVWLTLGLGLTTSLVLLVLGLPLANWLNRSRWRGVALIEALITTPFVLPSTVLGFYLLMAFSGHAGNGIIREPGNVPTFGFSFAALVAASAIYSLPFAVVPFQAALRSVPQVLIDMVHVEGASTYQTFLRVTLPLAARGIGIGMILSFAHTIGEFGIVLVLGSGFRGNVRVASIALYEELLEHHYALAHAYALALVLISVPLIVGLSMLRKKSDGPLR